MVTRMGTHIGGCSFESDKLIRLEVRLAGAPRRGAGPWRVRAGGGCHPGRHGRLTMIVAVSGSDPTGQELPTGLCVHAHSLWGWGLGLGVGFL